MSSMEKIDWKEVSMATCVALIVFFMLIVWPSDPDICPLCDEFRDHMPMCVKGE